MPDPARIYPMAISMTSKNKLHTPYILRPSVTLSAFHFASSKTPSYLAIPIAQDTEQSIQFSYSNNISTDIPSSIYYSRPIHHSCSVSYFPTMIGNTHLCASTSHPLVLSMYMRANNRLGCVPRFRTRKLRA